MAYFPPPAPGDLADAARRLLDAGVAQSAQYLTGLLIASLSADEAAADSPRWLTEYVDALVMHGDALAKLGEHPRALASFQQALFERRRNDKGPPAYDAPAFRESESEVKLRVSQCHMAMGEVNTATSVLVAIPSKARTLAVNLALGRLYMQSGVTRSAIKTFKEALAQNPYAIEAIVALAELQVSAHEVTAALAGSDEADPSQIPDDQLWLKRLAQAHCARTGSHYSEALQHWRALGRVFPKSAYVLANTGVCHASLGNTAAAREAFGGAWQADPLSIDHLDTYAGVLRLESAVADLNRISHQGLMVSDKRPEPWLALAWYCEARNQREKAIRFVDRAIALNDRRSESFQLKGRLLLANNRPELAIILLRKAHNIRSDLLSFELLVQGYVQMNKFRDALHWSREAVRAVPNNARSATLLGKALLHSRSNPEQARQVLENAMRIDQGCTDALLTFVQLLAEEGKFDEAIARIEKQLEYEKQDMLHARLADLYTVKADYCGAMMHYHTALDINPTCEAAVQGMARVEKLMQGFDPDRASEDALDDDDDDGHDQSFV